MIEDVARAVAGLALGLFAIAVSEIMIDLLRKAPPR